MDRGAGHLWAGNVRDDKSFEHFKRYGGVESVNSLPNRGADGGVAAFADNRFTQKDHTTLKKMGDLDHRMPYSTLGAPWTPAPVSDQINPSRGFSEFRGVGGGPTCGPPQSFNSWEHLYKQILDGYGGVESVNSLPNRGADGGVAPFANNRSTQKDNAPVKIMGALDHRMHYSTLGAPSTPAPVSDMINPSRGFSEFRGVGEGSTHGPPQSFNSWEHRYKQILERATKTLEQSYEHHAYGHHERETAGYERTQHLDQDCYRDPRDQTLQHGIYHSRRSPVRIEARTQEQFTLPSGEPREVRGRRPDWSHQPSPGRSHQPSPGRSHQPSPGRSHQRSPGRSHQRSPGRSHQRSPGRSHQRSPGRSHQRSPGRSHQRSPGRSHQRNRSRSPYSSQPRNQFSQRLASRESRPARSPSFRDSRHRLFNESLSNSRMEDGGHDSSDRSATARAPPSQPLSADTDILYKTFGLKVQNFPVRSSDTNIRNALFYEFKKYGKVTSVQIHGVSEERYGLIFFMQQADQREALYCSKGKRLLGMELEVMAWDGPEGENECQPLDKRIDEFDPKATRTLFISNLEETITRLDLHNVFQRFGEIVDIDIKTVDGVPQYAFILYSDITSVCKAINKMDGEYLGKKRLKLGFGNSMPTNCVWISDLPSGVTEEYLRHYFSRHGPVLKVVNDQVKGMALISFKESGVAQTAVEKSKWKIICGKEIKLGIGSCMPTNCVWIKGLPSGVPDEYLRHYFGCHGPVLKVVNDQVKRMALISFKETEFAQAAVENTMGKRMRGKKIKLDFANQSDELAFYRSMESSEQAVEEDCDVTSERSSDEYAATPAPPSQTLFSSDDDEPRESFGIKVENLPVRRKGLKYGLYKEFKKYGELSAVQIHGIPENRYGLVFFRHQDDQQVALNDSQGTTFLGVPMKVTSWEETEIESEFILPSHEEKIDEFHPKATRTLFISNLEETTTRFDVHNVFQRFGEIVDIDIKTVKGILTYAFLQYCDVSSVCKAIKAMHGEYLGKHRLKAGFGKSAPTNCVWLGGLPIRISEQFLRHHFNQYGPVLKVVHDHCRGIALVLYRETEFAKAAVEKTKWGVIAGCKVKVDFANQGSQMAFCSSMGLNMQDICEIVEGKIRICPDGVGLLYREHICYYVGVPVLWLRRQIGRGTRGLKLRGECNVHIKTQVRLNKHQRL